MASKKLQARELKLRVAIYLIMFCMFFIITLVIPDIVRYSQCDVETLGTIINVSECNLISPVQLYNYTVQFTDSTGCVQYRSINASYMQYYKGDLVYIVYPSDNDTVVRFRDFISVSMSE